MVGKARKTHRSGTLPLLSPMMRDFASCFSEHAVRVSDSSCSGSTGGGAAAPSSVLDPSVQSDVSCVYRTRLSTQKELLVNVAWSRTQTGSAVSVGIDNGPSHHSRREMKGRRLFASGESMVGLHWDLSAAKYGPGPEPVGGFYVAVIVDAELALLLGEMSGDVVKEFNWTIPTAGFSTVSRREQVLGCSAYSTKTRFRDGGRDHDITVRCRGDWSGTGESELSVCVDRKRVVHVTRLEYNFRGNQTIFVEGSPVDLMWDAHGWWFGGPSGCAVFLFRTRSALESRLWLEEMLHREEEGGTCGFSLVIQAFKTPMRIALW